MILKHTYQLELVAVSTHACVCVCVLEVVSAHAQSSMPGKPRLGCLVPKVSPSLKPLLLKYK